MPLINHVRGDAIPNALINVRTPIIRLPLWTTVTWSILRTLARLVVAYVRFWPVTMPIGQIPDDFAAASVRLAYTFGARSCTVAPGRKPNWRC